MTFNTKISLSLSAGMKIILLRKEDLSHVPSAHFHKVLSLKALITTDGKLFNFFYYFSENIRPGIYCLKCLPNRNTEFYHFLKVINNRMSSATNLLSAYRIKTFFLFCFLGGHAISFK